MHVLVTTRRRANTLVLIFDWLMIAYIALFSALLSRFTALACGSTWVTSFIAYFLNIFFNINRSGVLTALAWLVPHETAAVSAQVLCTPYNHAPCHFMQSHIRKVYACLAVTCHLHSWQNDRDLLRVTAVTRGCTFAGISNQWPKNTSVVSKNEYAWHVNVTFHHNMNCITPFGDFEMFISTEGRKGYCF